VNISAPGNGFVAPQQPVQGHVSPRAEAKMTLFHWQIEREEWRLGGISPELLNIQDRDGDTCLHIAVAQGKRALAYVLATKMAGCGSLDLKERNGQTALQIAAATDQHLLVRDLLSHGAQVNTWDLWGRSPLHVCAEKGHFLSLQVTFNFDGLTPLHTAVMSHNAVVRERRIIKNLCLYRKTELAKKRWIYVQCVKILLLMGASFGTMRSGRTCVHMASEEANVELLRIFLRQSSSHWVINMFNGNTALHVASALQNHKSQVEAVKLLLMRGADPNARNLENELPSQLLPEWPTAEKVRLLLRDKISENELFQYGKKK
uniref:Uncharacterized protein n=1 Tax=Mola mola TaxID=94237 RepID=A0A3Q3WR07_MOLML